MFRRHAIPVICVTLALVLAGICGFIVFNFTQLSKAQTFAQDFVRLAVAEGSSAPMPTIAPAAGSVFAEDRTKAMLNMARRVGPLVSMGGADCAVQTDPSNVCGGQLLACAIQGVGHNGVFEADIAMCRGGDLTSYQLAGSLWKFRFQSGDPETEGPQSPI